MLLVYTRHTSLERFLAGVPSSSLGEPRINERGDLRWHIEGGALSNLSEVVPSISDIGSPELRSRFVVRATMFDGVVGEVSLDWIGGAPQVSLLPSRSIDGGPLKLDVDTVFVSAPIRSLELALEFAGGVRPSKDALITVSLRGPIAGPYPHGELVEGRLAVPMLSQFEQSPTLGHRICSPTSVAMVLSYYGYGVTPLELAERCYAEQHDLYGVWPRNVWAASAFGIPGCLVHIESWSTVDYLLRCDTPIVASIRYHRDELRGAPFYRPNDEMTAHLVVVTGHAGGKILVNDPAASSAGEVPRMYDIREFERVWFGRSAIGYILVPPHRHKN